MGAFQRSRSKLPLTSKSLPIRLTSCKLMSFRVVPSGIKIFVPAMVCVVEPGIKSLSAF